MLFPVEPVPLRDLAERNGLGFADVVTLAGIPSSMLNRLWKEPDWAARSTGAALQGSRSGHSCCPCTSLDIPASWRILAQS
jgi:hypothetical protein